MIICRYNGEIHYITDIEDFRELVAPEIFEALLKFFKIKEHDAELENAQADTCRLEKNNMVLSDKLLDISKVLMKLHEDRDLGYITQEEFEIKYRDICDQYPK